MSGEKIRVGIFFGGSSREREVSFAGGRTVYDNLDKNLFEPVPYFVDSFGTFIELKWEYIYRGTIRDFYPTAAYLPESPNGFQVYVESLDLSDEQYESMIAEIGERRNIDAISRQIDVAFLALHGEDGEDGRIQGLLEWYRIPYTGSGILPSAIGIDKVVQKELMRSFGFDLPAHEVIAVDTWVKDPGQVIERLKKKVGFPLVVKAARQGSSIGVTILREADNEEFTSAIDAAFFRLFIRKDDWIKRNKQEFVRQLCDYRSGLGCPLVIEGELVKHPEKVLSRLEMLFEDKNELLVEASVKEARVVVESMISGKEFSCIVIADEQGEPIALPPTEIIKGSEIYDYKSKYLPGLSRKVTPIDLPDDRIEEIRQRCSELYKRLKFNVYARIDGFIQTNGKIYLNDPNTTSGMMPSSFFFHQAAEIGLNPSKFLTYIIRTSVAERMSMTGVFMNSTLLNKLDELLRSSKKDQNEKIRVGVIMGGFSTERHISVESGRNIYEKLASSSKYEPVPVFLTGNKERHELYVLPVNVMLKDNADDIKWKVEHFKTHSLIENIIEECHQITSRLLHDEPVWEPLSISYKDLAEIVDEVFIALHGRPGEDGAVQAELDKLNVPYNGSGVSSSQRTINKFETNNYLRSKGFLVANNALVDKETWINNKDKVIEMAGSMGYPLIAKPVDEGCSSAVKKIDDQYDLIAFATLSFRGSNERDHSAEKQLDLDPKEEFPSMDQFLLENFISKGNAVHFLEITGGMLTHTGPDGGIEYEVFEPSEALAEGEVLSLAEKFLAGEGQNITPARFDIRPDSNRSISDKVKKVLKDVAKTLNVEGYCRIDAFVRVLPDNNVEVVIIEINSLPGMTPATCIYHQAAINGYKPYQFIDGILEYGRDRLKQQGVN